MSLKAGDRVKLMKPNYTHFDGWIFLISEIERHHDSGPFVAVCQSISPRPDGIYYFYVNDLARVNYPKSGFAKWVATCP